MSALIINADDFGRHEEINNAVALACEKGCLRSATLMPGGTAFAHAVNTAKSHPALGVGIHLTLVNGNPVLAPAEIPSLVDSSGHFWDNHAIFVKRFLSGKINLEEVQRELAAQIRKVQQTELSFTHIDSHQHMHTLPGINKIALRLAQEAGINAVRISQSPLNSGSNSGGLGQFIGRLGLNVLARLTRLKANSMHMKSPEHFAGIVAGEAVTPKHLQSIIRTLPKGTTEVMLHPGTNNALLQDFCQWEHDFEAELAAVTSQETINLLQENNIQLKNFADL